MVTIREIIYCETPQYFLLVKIKIYTYIDNKNEWMNWLLVKGLFRMCWRVIFYMLFTVYPSLLLMFSHLY